MIIHAVVWKQRVYNSFLHPLSRSMQQSTALERSVLKYWGLKPVLWVPNLALSFCYITRIINNRNGNVELQPNHLVIRKAG